MKLTLLHVGVALSARPRNGARGWRSDKQWIIITLVISIPLASDRQWLVSGHAGILCHCLKGFCRECAHTWINFLLSGTHDWLWFNHWQSTTISHWFLQSTNNEHNHWCLGTFSFFLFFSFFYWQAVTTFSCSVFSFGPTIPLGFYSAFSRVV